MVDLNPGKNLTTFEGRTYSKNSGYKGWGIRLEDRDGGVATTAYSYSMSEEERFEMARRITAALNVTRYLTVDQMERNTPIGAPK